METLPTELKDPGEARIRERYDWDAVAQDARSAAGAWIVIGRPVNRGYVSAIRNGRIKAFTPVGNYEARSKSVPGEDLVELFIRYVGEEHV